MKSRHWLVIWKPWRVGAAAASVTVDEMKVIDSFSTQNCGVADVRKLVEGYIDERGYREKHGRGVIKIVEIDNASTLFF